jgi:hypothetical protein
VKKTNVFIVSLTLALAVVGQLAMGAPEPADAIRLIGKGQTEVVKALGPPTSSKTEKNFREATWRLAKSTPVTFHWNKDGTTFNELTVAAGSDWNAALKKVGLSPTGVKPVLTSEWGIELYRKKMTFELRELKGLPAGAYCIWDASTHSLHFENHRP